MSKRDADRMDPLHAPHSGPPTWDYAVRSYELAPAANQRMAAEFQKFGEDGFELVAVVAPFQGIVQCFFKRRGVTVQARKVAPDTYDFG